MPTINTRSMSFVKEKVNFQMLQKCSAFPYEVTERLIKTFFISVDVAASLPASVQKLQVSSAAHQKQQELLKQVAEQQFVPKEPPPEPEFVADPPSISALDL